MSKPKIEYPCEWSYTIIGADEAALRAAAELALVGKDFTIALSKRSKSGKYTSMCITTSVATEEERNAIFQKLSESEAIKIII